MDLKEACGNTFEAGVLMCKKPCFICGKQFRPKDKAVIFVVYGRPEYIQVKDKLKRVKGNIMAHADEFQELIKNCNTIMDVLQALEATKKPKSEKMTEEMKKRVETFKKAAGFYGYHNVTDTKTGCKCRKASSSDVVEYCVYGDTIEHFNRRRGYMFSHLVSRQIETNIYNKFHEYLGDGEYDEFNALSTISNAVNKAKEIVR